jgi:hypothetical protein
VWFNVTAYDAAASSLFCAGRADGSLDLDRKRLKKPILVGDDGTAAVLTLTTVSLPLGVV